MVLVTVPPTEPEEQLRELANRLFTSTDFIEQFGMPHRGGPYLIRAAFLRFHPRLNHSNILPAFQPIDLADPDKRRLSSWMFLLYYCAWQNSEAAVRPKVKFSVPHYDLRDVHLNENIDDDLTTNSVSDRLKSGEGTLKDWVTDHFGAFDVHAVMANCVHDQMLLPDWRKEKKFRKPICPFPDFFSCCFDDCLFNTSSEVIKTICHQYGVENSGTEASPLPVIDFEAETIKWQGKTYGSIPKVALEMLDAIVSAKGHKVTSTEMKKAPSRYPNLSHEDRLDRIKRKLPSEILKHIDSTTNGHSWKHA